MSCIKSEVVEICGICSGTGKAQIFDDRVRKWIRSGDVIFDPIHKNWKYSDIIKCEKCDGMGKVRRIVYDFGGNKFMPSVDVLPY